LARQGKVLLVGIGQKVESCDRLRIERFTRKIFTCHSCPLAIFKRRTKMNYLPDKRVIKTTYSDFLLMIAIVMLGGGFVLFAWGVLPWILR